MILYLIYGFGMVTCTVSPLSRFTAHLLPVYSAIYKRTSGGILSTTLRATSCFYFLGGDHFKYLYLCGGTPKIIKILVVVPQIIGFFQEKIPGGVGTPSIIWGTTTRILIIFGVPPHKYKYLK
jgi:hypothetical protein